MQAIPGLLDNAVVRQGPLSINANPLWGVASRMSSAATLPVLSESLL